MIARAITAIIGVVIGLFATFAVFSAILGGLDSFYLLTQDACNYGSLNSPKRLLRVAPENPEHPRDADEIDWSRHGLDLTHDGSGGCVLEGGFDADEVYLSPTGERVDLSAGGVSTYATTTIITTESTFAASVTLQSNERLLASETLHTGDDAIADIWTDGTRAAYVSNPIPGESSSVVYLFDLGEDVATATYHLNTGYKYGPGVVRDGDALYVVTADDENFFHRYSLSADSGVIQDTYTVSGDSYTLRDLHKRGSDIFVLGYDTVNLNHTLFQYATAQKTYDEYNMGTFLGASDYGMAVTANDELLVLNPGENGERLYVMPDYRDASTDSVIVSLNRGNPRRGGIALNGDDLYAIEDISGNLWLNQYQLFLSGGGVTTSATTTIRSMPTGDGLRWLQAENVFTAQEQLVTLLAVIAAIGMPIGAMTAIVFFGQAVISSGIGGQGASQVLVAIAAVVVILVSIQMFQQFAGFLGTAFDAVNGDRFVVFDESLGSLAETIAEFWGVLAFAGFINIASIVWRNYSGNFSIGGTQGGL